MSFPTYGEYRDSGVEWLGPIPAHWDVLSLKRVATLRSGDSITAEQISEEGEYPVLGGNGVRGYTSSYTHDGHFPVIGRQGALCGNVNYGHGRFWASEHAVVATPAMPINVVWFGELLRAMDLNQYSLSAAQPGLSVEVLSNLRTVLPPIEDQDAIAMFLDQETCKIDDLVAEQQWLIELLKEKRQAVISHAVTKGLNPDAPMKDSGVEWLGKVPAHWDVLPLKRLATVRTGVAKGKDLRGHDTIVVPYLRVANVQDGYLDLEEVKEIEILASELDRYRLRRGDVLMNEGGDFDKLGRGCIWTGEIDPCITQNHVFAVRPTAVTPEWLSFITQSSYAQFYFMQRSKQSTNLASISSTNLLELPVVLPPAAEQYVIRAAVLAEFESAEMLRASAQQSIALLQERRTVLISAAVTGKIDVRNLMDAEAVAACA